jgi:hypothetical protein
MGIGVKARGLGFWAYSGLVKDRRAGKGAHFRPV